jgi:26S proteasome regulatory subunit N3
VSTLLLCLNARNLITVSLISLFLAAQRTASLRHDDEAQAALINCLLRSYISYNLYDQADKLVSKTTFPASASNAQFARYHYYLGRIRAVQLNYTEAHTNLQQAIRRAPPAKTAPGFYQAVHKYFVVVELLMGDIPDRSLFRHVVLEKALTAYFDIVKGMLFFSPNNLSRIDPGCYFSCTHRLSRPIPNHPR